MRSLALSLALVALPVMASAQPCSRGRAGVPMPIALSSGTGDFGTTPSPCSDARVGVDLRASALIDTPDFYGALGGELVLSGTLPLTQRLWLSGSLTAPRFRFAQNATVIGTDLGTGPGDLALHVSLVRDAHLRVSTYVRALLPFDLPTQYALRTGLDAGVSAWWTLSPRVSLLGGVSVPVELSFLGGRGLAYGSVRASLDASVLAASWFEPVLGFEARVGNDPAGALDVFAARASLRVHTGRAVTLHLSGAVPVAGLDRTLARISLGAWITL